MRLRTPEMGSAILFHIFAPAGAFFRGWASALLESFQVYDALFVCPGGVGLSLARFSGVVMGNMLATCHKFKILKPVVHSVFVLVMDNFIRFKRTAKMLFHDVAMLKDFSSAVLYDAASVMNPPLFVWLAPPDMRCNSVRYSLWRLFVSFSWHIIPPIQPLYHRLTGFANRRADKMFLIQYNSPVGETI